jgi:hypothetical protein
MLPEMLLMSLIASESKPGSDSAGREGRTSQILKIPIRANHTPRFFDIDLNSIPLPIIETF